MSMTGAISEQFSKFVQFAEDQSAKGKNRAIATKSDIAANGGNTLEERNIAVTSKIDWVSLSFLRSDGAKRVNNEVRDIFKKTVFDMFGGERNVPDSVKEAMLMKDYGCGKPLTARRIIAVRDAIVALNRVNCFDGEIDVGGQLAQRAIANGYTRLDFGRLNTAANFLVEAKRGTEGELSYGDALEQVITKGSAANRTMNIGSLYMKSADDFRRGLEFHERIAAGDARNLEVARLGAGKDSVGSLSEIAENLEYKYENLLHDADAYLDALGMPRETLAELRQAITEVKGKFKTVKSELSSGALNGDREKAYERLFRVNLGGIHQAVEKIVRGLRDVAAQNPAIEEFRQYLAAHISQGGVVYDRLTRTYQEAVALDMTESAKARLVAAAHEGGVKNNSSGEIPAAILDNVDKFLAVAPFDRIKKLEKFCECLERGGSANLRFTAEQKAELGAMVEQAFGKGPKADKVLARLVEQFEASFFAEQMLNPTDFVKNPPTGPGFIVGYFKAHPAAFDVFDPGLKLGTPEEVAAAKDAIKNKMVADLNKCLALPDGSGVCSLASGLFPQGVREYNVGYVTFNGGNIPNAEYGTKFPQLNSDCDIPERKGYAEFLEKTFGAGYTKMRQMVSFVCSMANGLGGTIDSMVDHGDDCLKGLSRVALSDINTYGFALSSGERSPDENYNIEVDGSGNYKITFTHFIQNSVSSIMNVEKDEKGEVTDVKTYNSKLISHMKDCTILGRTKLVVTMTVTNASDAELGAGQMPEFSIDNIVQEDMA